MNQAAAALVGRHDFTAFVAANAGPNRVRTIYRAECRRDGDLVVVELEGNGFMKQMARSIVGTLVDVGLGKLSADDLARILESRDRRLAGPTAPAHGLYLYAVRYPDSSMAQIEAPDSRRAQANALTQEKV
jgi:tRNA pseudouridine38-40 synthase